MTINVSTQDFIRSANKAAQHYGFSPLETLCEHEACRECGQKVKHKTTAQDRREDSLHGILTSGIHHYFDNKIDAIEGPSLFYVVDKVPRTGDIALSFHVFGVQKSIAEALLIQTIRSLLNEVGQTKHVVRINSLGDSDSLVRYTRDLTTYLRKRLDDMPPQARELMKQHPCLALMYLVDKKHELAQKSPSPLEYLSDSSRKHFREIVEFLDMTETPFEIDPQLVGHHNCYSDALFAIDVLDDHGDKLEDDSVTIRGGRYDIFVNRMSKKETPATGAVVMLKDKKVPSRVSRPRTQKIPSIYLAQLGFGPKVRSLVLLEELRNAGIAVQQNLTSDSLSEQLHNAAEANAQFAVIVGHKEYMEQTAIVRNLLEQNQENVPQSSLVSYLKRRARA